MGPPRAMLFAPPQPPVRLAPDRETLLGRSPSCELALPSRQASRRHAAVRLEGDAFVLRDLGSTNGTFVNGEQVLDERRLAPGDRIEIGDRLVTFCQVEGDVAGLLDAPSDDQTVVQRREASAVLRGDLAEIPAFALLQMLELGLTCGVLEVEAESGKARLWLEHGQPVHAEADGIRGADAAFFLMQRATGRFDFAPGDPPPERTIQASLTELLLEATRQLDEQG